MGSLYYGAGTSTVEFEDRVLAHLQLAMVAKLRRGENFVFSWDVEPEKGSGSHSLWISPTIPLRFTYQGGRRGPINRSWVEALVKTANSVSGLRIVDEPTESVLSASRDDEISKGTDIS